MSKVAMDAHNLDLVQGFFIDAVLFVVTIRSRRYHSAVCPSAGLVVGELGVSSPSVSGVGAFWVFVVGLSSERIAWPEVIGVSAVLASMPL